MLISHFQHRYAKGTSSRVILALHGTGGTENDLIPLAKNIDPNASILSPRGQVSENGMPRFFRRLAEGVFDVPDLILRTNELADWLDVARQHYGFDRSNLVAVGYSNGANIASSLMLLRPDSLTTAVLLRPMVPMVPEALSDLSGKRVLIAAGAFDPIAPASQVAALEKLLRDCRASVTTHVAEASHGLVKEDVDTAIAWLGE